MSCLLYAMSHPPTHSPTHPPTYQQCPAPLGRCGRLRECLRSPWVCRLWREVGGWVVECMNRKVEEIKAVRMNCCGWVGGWVGGWTYRMMLLPRSACSPRGIPAGWSA